MKDFAIIEGSIKACKNNTQSDIVCKDKEDIDAALA